MADTEKRVAARYRSERHSTRRKHTGIRLDESELSELDEFAIRRGFVDRNGEPVRSPAIRLRNAYARKHMPDDYTGDSV